MAARTGKALKAADLSDQARPRPCEARRFAYFAALAGCGTFLMAGPAMAAECFWRGTNSYWSTPSNWTMVVQFPGTPDIVNFDEYAGAEKVVQVPKRVSLGGIRFNSGAPSYAVGQSGSIIDLAPNAVISVDRSVSGPQTIGADLYLGEGSSTGAQFINGSLLHPLVINGTIEVPSLSTSPKRKVAR